MISFTNLLIASTLLVSAPKLKENPAPKPPFDKNVNATVLFDWVFKQDPKDKPWREVYRIESLQDNQHDWGWSVYSALKLALAKKYPDCTGGLLWEFKEQGIDIDVPIPKFNVTASVFHLMATGGKLGPVDPTDW